VDNDDKTFGGVNQVQMLAKKLRENKSSLHIARIPEKTKKLFITIAEEEFCSDYGMLVKFLLDKVIAGDNKNIVDRLNSQEKRIDALETKKEEDSIKTLNGRRLKK